MREFVDINTTTIYRIHYCYFIQNDRKTGQNLFKLGTWYNFPSNLNLI